MGEIRIASTKSADIFSCMSAKFPGYRSTLSPTGFI